MDDDIATKVEPLQLGPDDTVVISVREHLTQEAAEQLRAQVAQALDGRRVLVLADGVTLEKLTDAQRQRLLAGR